MNKFQEFRKWVEASPKNGAILFLCLIPIIFLIQLAINTQFTLDHLFRTIVTTASISAIYAYLFYVTQSLRKNGQEIPRLESTFGFSRIALAVKVTSIFALLFSLWVLITFRIENWGSEPDFQKQVYTQLVGIAFFIPIGILYFLCCWFFSSPKYLLPSYLLLLPALALSVWNMNYAWHSPASPMPNGYEQFYWLVFRIPLLPFWLMLIPLAVWLFTAWSKLKQQSKLT